MSTIYRASIHCDAQRSVHCHGLFTVAGEPQTLADQAWDAVTAKGWLRMRLARPSGPVTRDVCPACQQGPPMEPTS